MNRKTLTAGAVFAGLAIVAFVLLRQPEKGTRSGDGPRPFPKVAAGGIDTLEITKGGATTIVTRTGDDYKVTAPVAYAADKDGAKQAFDTLENLEFDGIVTDQAAKHGDLEVGPDSVRVVAKKGATVVADFRVGKVANSATMIRVEGKNEVWQAIGFLKYQFDKDASAWRDKSIVTFEQNDAEKIEVATARGDKILLEKPPVPDGGVGAGDWRVISSTVKVDPLDTTIATGMLSALYAWKTNDFADAATPAETGLANPALTVTITVKGGKQHTVQIGNKKGEDDYYVKNAELPQVFLVKKYNLDRVMKRPIEFRDKTICNLTENEIAEIDVARAKDGFTLRRAPGKTGAEAWSAARPAGFKLDTNKVNAIVMAFNNWKASSFAENNAPAATGLGSPVATIVARSNLKGSSSCVLRVGGETADKQSRHVQVAGKPDVMVVPTWSLDRVTVKLDDIKKS